MKPLKICYTESSMENGIEENNNQQTVFPQNPLPQNNVPINQKGNFLLILGIVVLVLIVGVIAYFLGAKNNQTNQYSTSKKENQQLSPTNKTEQKTITATPKLAAFMKKGDIWLKDFASNKELKVSKTSIVESPHLSSDGKYVAYFSIIHATGGFPRGNLYLTDAQGSNESSLGLTNGFASRLTWSKDANYLGYILFPDGQASKAVLYDAGLNKKITETEVNSLRKDSSNIPVLTIDKSYNVDLNCNKLDTKYLSFCKEYEQVLNSDAKPYSGGYKTEQYSKSQYTKANYKLTRSEHLDNGLVVLEYYTGEPQNPESKWGEGGGSFVPGYDEGVTETYTVLMDESTGKIITEIPLAIDTNFIF